ncbi:MAG TPA: glycosyltransferase [Brumimicrobium sp.]|nr:glycosyltransferase [Brumimicrobium sp.]
MLSILIPVYNFNCVSLVKELHSQCVLADILFEILVLDDTSTQFKSENSVLNELENCQYIESVIHFGRAKIRNELGKRAQYENLLFIDADALVDRPDFIKNYLENIDKADVIIGGVKYSQKAPQDNVLRWYYGTFREFKAAETRNQSPYKSLSSFNILIKKDVFKKHSFDEKSIDSASGYYGHEDTLLGLEFKENSIPIHHIDNQLIHNSLESDQEFLEKSLVAVEKYVSSKIFRNPEVVAQIKIFKVFEKVKKYRLVGLFSFFFKNFEGKMKKKLFKPNPSLRLFDFYRLSYLADYYKKNRG